MNASFQSFISENSNRAFPFVENSEFLLPENTDGRPDNDVFLDFRGWSRLKLLDQVALFLIDPVYDISSHSHHSGLESYAKDKHVSIFFKAFYTTDPDDISKQVMCFNVPMENTQSEWIYVSDANGLLPNGKFSWSGKVAVTQRILEVTEPAYYMEIGDAIQAVERSQFFELGGAVIDRLDVIDAIPADRYLADDVRFLPGLNTSVTQSGSTIQITSQPGLGTGRQVYTGTDIGEVCNGITKINGEMPDDNGQFYIRGEGDVIVEDVPSEHLIRISLNKNNPASTCP